ncbi:hypothetical protein EDEG_00292 [Edhazardia aedis USNM 41457]|uniref:Uncharacterized protein n=1 Tax=Edhazardia aedis (strain USNM 41457) TaxID=1003232 RepID=J8ZRS7_EDHAE|nr:hypothetical protein EDEG_00292 [Edhazardia aedis USNM 41457]|eukprot:EJW02398.1 hypothetical protein EDEG_00292 [Edhazardia aedis USNM 41457]
MILYTKKNKETRKMLYILFNCLIIQSRQFFPYNYNNLNGFEKYDKPLEKLKDSEYSDESEDLKESESTETKNNDNFIEKINEISTLFNINDTKFNSEDLDKKEDQAANTKKQSTTISNKVKNDDENVAITKPIHITNMILKPQHTFANLDEKQTRLLNSIQDKIPFVTNNLKLLTKRYFTLNKNPFPKNLFNDMYDSQLKKENQPIRSISKGKITTDSSNLNTILNRELSEVSKDMKNKVQQAIGNLRTNTPQNYKEVIIIKKRILSNGKRKLINVNVQDKVVPKDDVVVRNSNFKDFGVRAVAGGILFLIAGLLFTSSIKVYQTWIRKKYIKIGDKSEKSKTDCITL